VRLGGASSLPFYMVGGGGMRSRCSGRYGSIGGVRGRETTAAAVEPGRKTTGRGPHVSEGGDRKARWAGAGERRGGPWLGQKPEMGQSSKEILFEFQLILEIWQKFGKMHKEI
jgi:hypothetical protein